MYSLGSPLPTMPPSGRGTTGMTPLLTNLAVTSGGGSPPSMTLDGPVATYGNSASTTYHTSFRSSQGEGPPPTGLGILMSSHNGGSNNGGSASTTHTLHHQHHNLASFTPAQRKLMQKDVQDRESQAQALAAAGMAAEHLSPQLRPVEARSNNGGSGGLHPPPTLGNHTSGIAAALGGSVNVTSSNPGGTNNHAIAQPTTSDPCMSWTNLELMNPTGEISSNNMLTLEEMEMDFANLFDPNVEWENMQTEGSGWPQMKMMGVGNVGEGVAGGNLPGGGIGSGGGFAGGGAGADMVPSEDNGKRKAR